MDVKHKEANYFIDITKIDNNTLTVFLPRNIFKEFDEALIYITIESNGIEINDGFSAEFIETPNNTQRSRICEFILAEAILREMAPRLIHNISILLEMEPNDNNENQYLKDLIDGIIQ